MQAFIVFLITCKNEEDPIKNEGTRVLTRFSPLYVYGDFFRHSRAAYSAVLGRIWLKFKLLRDIINVLVICKYEEDPIKNEGARVLTSLYDFFFRRSRATNSEVSGGILPKFKLIQAFIVVLVKSMGIFSDAQGQLTPQSWSNLAEIPTRPRYYRCPGYLQV